MPSVDGPPACPFIAFEDERDERASAPDHRHRCYAEVRPAPRALAHQEAYCLSSAFPVCPTFQDWARREAAQARGSSARGSSGAAATAASVAAQAATRPSAEVRPEDAEPERDEADEADEPTADPTGGPSHTDDDLDDADEWSQPRPDAEPLIRRNPPRDWAAPPPWASGTGSAGTQGTYGRPPADGDSSAPEFLASRSAAAAGAGLAGSAADRLASGEPVGDHPAAPPSDELAGLVAAPAVWSAATAARPVDRPPTGHYQTTAASGRRPTVSSTRPKTPPAHDGPSWEQAKRYEAYPTIKTRARLPGVPRLATIAGGLVIAALFLLFLPTLLGIGGGGGGAGSSASPAPSGSEVAASDSPEPTPSAAPTQQTYTIKAGDTLNKISKKFGLTVDQLLAANKQIKNPNKIAVGDVLVIPIVIPDEVTDPSAEAPSASPKP
jgi:LysM repeat protein